MDIQRYINVAAVGFDSWGSFTDAFFAGLLVPNRAAVQAGDGFDAGRLFGRISWIDCEDCCYCTC